MTDTKSSVSIELDDGNVAVIRALKAVGGTEHFKITHKEQTAYVLHDLLVGDDRTVKQVLLDQRVLMTCPKDWRAIRAGMVSLSTFTDAPLLVCPGWSGDYYAWKNGKVLSPKGKQKARAIFTTSDSTTETSGKLSDWIKNVAKPLSDQHLPMIAILATFAAPMLRFAGITENFGFDFSGPGQAGKSTLLRLMQSMQGDTLPPPSFNSTLAGLDPLNYVFEDRIFPIDEGSHIPADKADEVKSLIFRMASGQRKLTANQPLRDRQCFIFATTANRPIYQMLAKQHPEIVAAATQRLIPLGVKAPEELGIFDFLPEEFASSGEFVKHIEMNISRFRGTVMKRFMRALVDERAKDPDRFESNIRGRIARFEKRVGITDTSMGTSRVSAAFGLLYAAGCFAKTKKMLPSGWDCLAACRAGYENFQNMLPSQTPLAARLRSAIARAETLDLRLTKTFPELTDAEVKAHGAFIIRGKKGRTELLIAESLRMKLLPDLKQLQKTNWFQEHNLSDPDRQTKQRQIRQGKKRERFVCFVVPTDWLAS